MAVFERKCGRCKGSGVYQLPNGDYGHCFGCATTEGSAGRVTVRTGDDKRTHDDNMRFVYSFLPVLRQRATAIAAADAPAYSTWAKEGLWALVKREPERLTKLRESVDAGRVDDVIRALAAYHNAR
jgi:hypothetical protein